MKDRNSGTPIFHKDKRFRTPKSLIFLKNVDFYAFFVEKFVYVNYF